MLHRFLGPASSLRQRIERAADSPVAKRIALLAAAALTALALLGPRPMLPRRVFDGIVVLDITQSMNTLDALLDGRPASRLVFAKAKLRQALARIPCGSRLGWGVFTEYRSYVLTLPVEVCGSYAELAATLERIDNTMAWAGGSEITKGLMSALRIAARIPEHPAIVFVTDGHEAPPLAADFVPVVPDDATEPHGLIAGVGGDALQPIPKYDQTGHPLGVWGPDEVMQSALRPGWSEPDRSNTAPAVAGTEHLSSLKESHLRELAALTGLRYVRLQSSTDVAELLRDDLSLRTLSVQVDTRTPLAGIALLLIVFSVGPLRRAAWNPAQVRTFFRTFRMSPSGDKEVASLSPSGDKAVASRRQISSRT